MELKVIHIPLMSISGIIFLLISLSNPVNGQPGGKAFQFLEVSNSARVAALGGGAVAIRDNDLDLPYFNPSLLNETMNHHITLNYVNYFSGVNYGYASAATSLGKTSLAGGIHYLNYGKFQGADENGNLTGTFRASDYSVDFVVSRPIDSLFSWGITLKSIYSDLESYNSTAIAFDGGITYHNPHALFTAGLVFRNAGWQVSTYYPQGARDPLPFNISLGISQGLKYAPLTFFIVADHLEKWDLTYTTAEDKENSVDPFTGESSTKSGFDIFIDQFMRHISIGTELNLGQNFVLRAGYNYRRRQEMKIESKPGMIGFSWGAGIKISKYRINYGHSTYHMAGGANYFSFSVNLDEFNKKF
jgi:hypothetical protein